MSQRFYEISDLPDSAVLASAAFMSDHLEPARALIGQGAEDSLAIILPAAPSDHRDWRRTLARDLARAHAPARVNVIGGSDADTCAALLHYLASAKGVTGQYLETHE
ncbi:MAG: Rossmann fold domain-containing protein [Erythrobacter sp.]